MRWLGPILSGVLIVLSSASSTLGQDCLTDAAHVIVARVPGDAGLAALFPGVHSKLGTFPDAEMASFARSAVTIDGLTPDPRNATLFHLFRAMNDLRPPVGQAYLRSLGFWRTVEPDGPFFPGIVQAAPTQNSSANIKNVVGDGEQPERYAFELVGARKLIVEGRSIPIVPGGYIPEKAHVDSFGPKLILPPNSPTLEADMLVLAPGYFPLDDIPSLRISFDAKYAATTSFADSIDDLAVILRRDRAARPVDRAVFYTRRQLFEDEEAALDTANRSFFGLPQGETPPYQHIAVEVLDATTLWD